jgi:iron complex outermembrane recepter protein
MALPLVMLLLPADALAQEQTGRQGRQIEELVVTAEKREAIVSDTSISITAFSNDFIEQMGLQNADDMVNFLPATTRDAYDIRIRGVGRNFRALGGDPGVATYYNDVYSEDFGIASTEAALYDVARIEVLRGPQGTLYGRNAIGGAINYITRAPTFDWTGEIRGQFGEFNAREYYGFVSGPMLDDRLAFRLTGTKRERDGAQRGLFGSPDNDSINDQNVALAFQLIPSENVTMNLRANDRRSRRNLPVGVIVDEGLLGDRGQRRTDVFAFGIRQVDASHPNAVPYTNPVTGQVVHGTRVRPGVDASPTLVPNPAFASQVYLTGTNDLGDVRYRSLTNDDNKEGFDHNAVSFDLSWDIADMTVKYVYGWSGFDYTYDFDYDHTNGQISNQTTTVLEDVTTWSHEVRLLWRVGDRFTATSGVYAFNSDRLQDYTLTNAAAQGRVTNAANYGFLMAPQAGLGGASIMQAAQLAGPMVRLGDAPVGTSIAGRWEGDPQGHWYHHINTSDTRQYAVYTQGTYGLNENLALTLGLRWARDEKEAFENRGGYHEVDFLGAFAGFYPFLGIPLAGQTDLSITNILMGAAVPTGNAANPIAPTCPLASTACPAPLRLGGVPISYTMKAAGDDRWGKVTWRANLDWTPRDNMLTYFSITTGYRAGGYALGVADARLEGAEGLELLTYDQEEVIAYEIGYKGTHLDRRMQLFASVYLYQYDNYQDQLHVFDAARQSVVDIVQNAPEARNAGFELEAVWLPTDVITLGGNYSYTHTEYTADYWVINNDDPALPLPLLGPAALTVNLKGNPLKRIPEHKSTLWGAYDWHTPHGNFRASAAWAYVGAYTTSGFDRSLDRVPSARRTDLSVTWTNPADNIRVRAFVDNVFDDIQLRNVASATHTLNYRRTATPLYPRFWGIDMRYAVGGR